MDKYELNLKMDQMKSLCAVGDFDAAADVANTINWSRVRNANVLVRIADIYEKAERLNACKELLLLAYDKAPIGRKIIFRLAELALKMEDYDLAQEYYEEFIDIAPNDNLRFVLQYEICKQNGASYKELIAILEEYQQSEYVEEWAYELAKLYHLAGYKDKCVAACDELILWFGEGAYVEKALELKLLYHPLTKEQEKKYRSYRMAKNGYTEIEREDNEHSEDGSSMAIPEVEAPAEKFNTLSLQKEIADGIQQIMDATEEDTVTDTMYNIKKLAGEIPYLQMEDGGEPTESEEIVPEKLEESKKPEINEMISEEDDGQLSMITEEEAHEKQITGQMTLQDILDDWEKKKKVTELAIQKAEAKRLENTKAKAIHEAESIMNRLSDILPKLDAGYTSKELMDEIYLSRMDEDAEAEAAETVETANAQEEQATVEESETLAEEPEVAAEESETPAEEPEVTAEESETPTEEPEVTAEEVENLKEEVVDVYDDLDDYDDDDYDDDDLDDEDDEEIDAASENSSEINEVLIEEAEPSVILEKAESPETAEFAEHAEEPDEITEEVLEEDDKALEVSAEMQDIMEAAEEVAAESEAEAETVETEQEVLEEEPAEAETEAVEAEQEVLEEEPAEAEAETETVETEQEVLEEEPAEAEAETETVEAEPKVSEEEPAEGTDNEDKGNKQHRRSREEALKVAEQKRMGKKPAHIKKLSNEMKSAFSYFVPIKGMERQLVNAINTISDRLSSEGKVNGGNLIIQGEPGCGKTVLATSFIKVLQDYCGYPDGKIGKIDAAALNRKDTQKLFVKVEGGCLIIEDAGKLDRNTAISLAYLMESDESGILVILEDDEAGIEKALGLDDNFSMKFGPKITVPIFTNDDLVSFARSYAKEIGYKIDDMASLALHNRISNIQRLDQATTLAEVKDIVDEAVERESHFGFHKYMSLVTGKRYTKDDRILLTERHFS